MHKTPEEVRAEHYAEQQRRDALSLAKSKARYRKWTYVGGFASALCALPNYLCLSPYIMVHLIYGMAVSAIMVRYKRGSWTGIFSIGLGNELVSAFFGTYNIIGFMFFVAIGGIIGISMSMERDS